MHQHTYLPTWFLFFPVCVVGAVTGSPIGWAPPDVYLEGFLFWGPIVLVAAIVDIFTLVCNSELWHAVHAHRAPCPRPCAPFLLLTSFPSFGSPLALLGLHPKEPVNGNTRTMLIAV
jgi:hypothetical protein